MIHDLPVGEHEVRVEIIYRLDNGGYLWVMTHKSTGKRIEAAAPFLIVVGTDIREKTADLQGVRGVKAPLPKAMARDVGAETAMLLPWKKMLFDRECTLEVEACEDSEQPAMAFVMTRT